MTKSKHRVVELSKVRYPIKHNSNLEDLDFPTAYTLCFMYPRNFLITPFVVKGYRWQVEQFIKSWSNCPGNVALMHKILYLKQGKVSSWSFTKKSYKIYPPKQSTPFIHKHRFYVQIPYCDSVTLTRSLIFKRMPKKWIPEFEYMTRAEWGKFKAGKQKTSLTTTTTENRQLLL